MATPAPALTPDFIPHSDAGSTPDFIPHTEPGAAMSRVKEGPQAGGIAPQTPTPTIQGVTGNMLDHLSDYWSKLTSDYDPGSAELADVHPIMGRVGQGLSSAGGTLMGLPGSVYHAVKDPLTTEETADFQGHTRIPGEVTLERLTGARQLVGAAKTYADPTTRPSLKQAAEVAPEALGIGVGNVAGGEVGGKALSGVNDFVRFVSDPVVRKTFSELDNAGKQHAAIMQGKVRTVNDLVRNPASRFQDAVMGEQGEVGQHANAVMQADEADMQLKGSQTGLADATPAVQAARDTLKQNMGTEFGSGPIEGLLQRATGPQSMRNLKALRTQVGKVASQMYRGGNKGEAAALYTLYDGLSQAGNTRAAELGPQASSSWNHYSDVTAQFKDMEKGVLGEMLDPANHTTDTAKSNLLKHVIDNPTGLKEVTNSMSKYGVDPAPLNKAVEIGQGLNEATQKTGNIVMGKLRAMIKHPLVVGAPAIAGGMMGTSLGLGGGIAGFVMPIAIAYHLNGLLDKIQLTKILREVSKRTDDASVTGELPERQPVPPPPAQSAPATVAPPTPSSGGGQRPSFSANPAKSVSPSSGPGYFGPERRVQEGGALASGERRQIPWSKAGPTEGEKLAESIRTTRNAKEAAGPRFEEGDAVREIMKDPARYNKYKKLRLGDKADNKVADAMLVETVRNMKQGASK